MSGLLDLQMTLLSACVEQNKECGDGPILTGEKNLDITKAELLERVHKNKNGDGYVDVLEYEHPILVRQGLFEGRFDREKLNIYFKIPDWDAFISAVNAFYIACYAPGCDDESEDEDCEVVQP